MRALYASRRSRCCSAKARSSDGVGAWAASNSCRVGTTVRDARAATLEFREFNRSHDILKCLILRHCIMRGMQDQSLVVESNGYNLNPQLKFLGKQGNRGKEAEKDCDQDHGKSATLHVLFCCCSCYATSCMYRSRPLRSRFQSWS